MHDQPKLTTVGSESGRDVLRPAGRSGSAATRAPPEARPRPSAFGGVDLAPATRRSLRRREHDQATTRGRGGAARTMSPVSDCARQSSPAGARCRGERGIALQREERDDDARVELASGCALDLGDGSSSRPSALVGPLMVSASNASATATTRPTSGIALVGKPIRISRAVPPFVMAARDDRSHLKHRRARAGEQARAQRGVGLHHLVLLCVERPALEQDAVRDRELADVVQRRRLAYELDLLSLSPSARRSLPRPPRPARCARGVVVAVLGRNAPAAAGLSVSLIQLSGSLGDRRFKPLRVVGKLLLGFALGADVACDRVDHAVARRSRGVPLQPSVVAVRGAVAVAEPDRVAPNRQRGRRSLRWWRRGRRGARNR